MNGILNVLKPPGMTSFDVVSYIRGLTKIKKIGHTGTLDPDAVGVLPICIGSATKAIEYITGKDKLYRAELTLGSSTDTQDSSGCILERREVNVLSEDIERVVKEFTGKIEQIPPMYSAVKVDGKKLYELARKGITVERKPRDIEIFSIKIIKNINQTGIDEPKKVIMDVHCSKGTYIRTLCHDMGERLGCLGHMSFLLRMKSGRFDLNTALTLQEIAEHASDKTLEDKLLSPVLAFDDMPEIRLDKESLPKFMNGVHIELGGLIKNIQGSVKVYDGLGKFIAIGEVIEMKSKTFLKSKKFF